MKKLLLHTNFDDVWDDAHSYFSKSRISSYKWCGIKFKKQYVDKTLEYQDTHSTLVGSRYHEFMELFMQEAPKYDPDKWHSFVHKDFTPEEQDLLHWTIDREIERYNRNPDYFEPIALEYKVVDHAHEFRGIIDRIEQFSDNIIDIVEYKTSKSIYKPSLQMEFGFYDIILDCIPELRGFRRRYYVINPRVKDIVYMNPSRKTTIFNKVSEIKSSIANDDFKPTCTPKYRMRCDVCTMEELLEFGVEDYCYE